MIFEPFGGLVILAVIAAALIVGLAVAIAGWKSKRMFSFGITIISAPWLLFFLSMFFLPSDIDEVNPTIASDSEVYGEWKTDDFTITLQPDSSFVATMEGQPRKGRWRRMDWNLYLIELDGIERYMRFVEDSGDLLLLTNPPEGDYFDPGPVARKTSIAKR